MARLRQSDLQAALDFLRDAEAVAGPTPFPPEILERLRQLVPCDLVSFCELDRPGRRLIGEVSSTGEVFEDDPEDPELESFWRLRHQHPVCAYHDRTGDWSARKLTDFLSARELRRLEMWSEWYVDYGRPEFELEVGLPSPLWHTKVFLFFRTDRDFCERDREILDLLQPHLAYLYESARLRRLAGSDDWDDAVPLTWRESQVIGLVEAGKSNAEVAAALWISPGTVRTHLENIYAKLGVHSRTAAVARVRGLNGATAR